MRSSIILEAEDSQPHLEAKRVEHSKGDTRTRSNEWCDSSDAPSFSSPWPIP